MCQRPNQKGFPMTDLLQKLGPKQRKGSKARCHLLTHGTPDQIAKRLTNLIEPYGSVSTTDKWMPRGFDDLEEAQLHKADRLLEVNLQYQLKSWWLAASHRPVTPNWDIAGTCAIDGKRGLFLVEAKAHHTELNPKDSTNASNESNFKSIGKAVCAANDGFNLLQKGWNLSHESHYQLCNRYAWSWKLATLGLPVLLVYLGFLKADEMPDPFQDDQAWDKAVRDYARDIVPENVWGSKLMVGDVPIYPLIRSMEIPLDLIDGSIEVLGAKEPIEI